MEKFAENCKVSQRLGVLRQILDNKFSYAFYFMKNYCLVLQLCYFKVKNIWISLKIVNLPF